MKTTNLSEKDIQKNFFSNIFFRFGQFWIFCWLGNGLTKDHSFTSSQATPQPESVPVPTMEKYFLQWLIILFKSSSKHKVFLFCCWLRFCECAVKRPTTPHPVFSNMVTILVFYHFILTNLSKVANIFVLLPWFCIHIACLCENIVPRMPSVVEVDKEMEPQSPIPPDNLKKWSMWTIYTHQDTVTALQKTLIQYYHIRYNNNYYYTFLEVYQVIRWFGCADVSGYAYVSNDQNQSQIRNIYFKVFVKVILLLKKVLQYFSIPYRRKTSLLFVSCRL